MRQPYYFVWIFISGMVASTVGCWSQKPEKFSGDSEAIETEEETEPRDAEERETDPLSECLQLKEVMTSEVSPAGVRTVFQLLDCDGSPITDLRDDELTVLLDGEEIREEGDRASVLTQEVEFSNYALLLLDMSDSIVNTGTLDSMVAAARALAFELIDQEVKIAIYRFAGPNYFAEVQPFTLDEAAVDDALDELATSDGLGTTDLYGAIPRAIDALEAEGASERVLTSRTLIVFTDGTDEAMTATFDSTNQAVQRSKAQVFTVGMGEAVDRNELSTLGKNGTAWAEDADALNDAFEEVSRQIVDRARSHYLIGVCSPRAQGIRTLTIAVEREEKRGALEVTYNAYGFDIVSCDAETVAFPCRERECGTIDGFSCGVCGTGELCNEEYTCEQVCSEAFECGSRNGVDCGDCTDRGAEYACGDDHRCVVPCEEAECGVLLGVDCGDCSHLGETFGCDEQHACVDACADAECGIVDGVDCGDCGHLGETFGCDERHACVDACADAECGVVLGVDCGDCGHLGERFGCDDDYRCVDACGASECGTRLGVDCGPCADGFECSPDDVCVPVSLPDISWAFVPGATVTLGCTLVTDPDCDVDEVAHDVQLSDFWIMASEVTVENYDACVAAGACDPLLIDTGDECNRNANRPSHPINCIEWEGLRQFCDFIDSEIPTEAQWERAYRGDHDGNLEPYWIYPWGSSPAPSCDRVVMNDGGPGCGTAGTLPRGSLPAGLFDLYDMAGNVAEWTRDSYAESFAGCGDGPCVNPEGPELGDERVVRGGSFNDMFSSAFRTAKRDKAAPDSRSAAIGGRCVK